MQRSLRIAVVAFSLVIVTAPASLAQGKRTADVEGFQHIAVGQNCPNWCWAAGAAMLARSQGVSIPQEHFVERIFGPGRPCLPTFGSFEPIARALRGTYRLAGGSTVAFNATYSYGLPSDVDGMIRSIRENRPFIFAWEGHVFVAYGVSWIESPGGRGLPPIQITQIRLIDPLFKFGRPKFASFDVGKHRFEDIDGTLELLVSRVGNQPPKSKTRLYDPKTMPLFDPPNEDTGKPKSLFD